MNEIKTAIEKLTQMEKDQLCYSYQEIPEMHRDGKPIYTNSWYWCHGANWYNLYEVTKCYGYSNAIFENRKRSAANVVYLGNLLIYDYDEKITIAEMKNKIESLGVSALIVTTLNHQKDKKGVVCDRFRLILQLKDCIGSDITTLMMEEVLQEVDNALDLGMVYDKACKTIERFYSPSSTQQHYYFDGMTLDILSIIDEIKTPKPKPVLTPRLKMHYAGTGLDIKDMREYIRENISHNIVVRELEAKGLKIDRKGSIYLDKKKVGNIHPETKMIANWGEGTHSDVIGILDQYYGESYIDNTKRLYEEIA